MKESRGRI